VNKITQILAFNSLMQICFWRYSHITQQANFHPALCVHVPVAWLIGLRENVCTVLCFPICPRRPAAWTPSKVLGHK
jgi:hypothetical protein